MFVNHLSNNITSNHTKNNGGGNQGSSYTFYGNLFIIIAYSLIALVSLCGNTLVLKVLICKRMYRTATNRFIATLTTVNLISTVNMPLIVAPFLVSDYPFHGYVCMRATFIQMCCVYLPALTMAVIAIHRCESMSMFRLCIRVEALNGIMWAVGVILPFPHAKLYRIFKVINHNQSSTVCKRDYSREFPGSSVDFHFLYSLEEIFTQYIIPLSITAILFIWIGVVISRQNSPETQRRQMWDRTILNQIDAEPKNIITQLSLVALAWALCWLPFNVYQLLVTFKIVKLVSSINIVCHWIAMSSVCYNPFIFWWWNESFRKSVLKNFRSCCRKRSSSSSSSDYGKHIELSHIYSVTSSD